MKIINTTTTSGVLQMTNTSGNFIKKDDESLVEYIELLYQLVGVDMSFDKFRHLSTSEKQAFVRDIKINKIIK